MTDKEFQYFAAFYDLKNDREREEMEKTRRNR